MAFGFQLALEELFFTFGDFFELVVDDGQGLFVPLQLGDAAFVVDGDGGSVLDRLLDVVDADVVAEDGAGVGVGLFDGRAGEADEGGVGQGVAHVAREAVDEIVLGAVGFVGDDDDVAARAELGHLGALGFGEEFLDGGEDGSVN